MIVRAAVTGHTRGIGKTIYDYLESLDVTVEGFCRSNGYDISNADVNRLIIHEAQDYNMFVNNAYDPFGQIDLLQRIIECWKDKPNKLIVNISSRYTHDKHKQYCQIKSKLDEIIREAYYNNKVLCDIINLKPGLTDTESVENVPGPRLHTSDIIEVLDWVLIEKPFKIHEITFGARR